MGVPLVADVGFDLAKLGGNFVNGGIVSAVLNELVFNSVKLSSQTCKMVLVNGFEVGEAGVEVGRVGFKRGGELAGLGGEGGGGRPWLGNCFFIRGRDLALQRVEPGKNAADTFLIVGCQSGARTEKVIAELNGGGGGC